jgi:phthiodiolone/phenolphthiodiolone dimycocerosates ketoreductase
MGDDSTGFQDLVPQTLDEQTALAHAAAAPISALKQYVLTGTPDEVIDQLGVWRDHGVRYPTGAPNTAMMPSPVNLSTVPP